MTNPEPLTPGPMQDGIPRCRHGRRDYIEVTSEALAEMERQSRNATLDEVLRAVEGMDLDALNPATNRREVIEAVKALRG